MSPHHNHQEYNMTAVCIAIIVVCIYIAVTGPKRHKMAKLH